jgi:hypothetical protein
LRALSGEEAISLWLASLGGDAWLAAQLEALGLSDRHESVADAREVRRVLEAVVEVARRHGSEGLDALREVLGEISEADERGERG